MGFQVEKPEAIRGTRKMLRLSLVLFCATPFGISQTPPPGSVSVDLANSLRMFFSGNCYTCHSSQAKMAGLDLSAMASRTPIPDDRITWEKVLTKLKSGQMPPPSRARPNEAELRTAIKNLEDALGARTAAIGPDPGHIAPHR